MKTRIVEINKTYFAHFVLIVSGKRMFRCLTTEQDRGKMYHWMEGYLHGLGNPEIQFDDLKEDDIGLFDMILW